MKKQDKRLKDSIYSKGNHKASIRDRLKKFYGNLVRLVDFIEGNSFITKFLRSSKIRTRLIVSFLALSILPLTVMGIYSMWLSSTTLDSKIRTYSKEAIEQVGIKIEDELKKYDNYTTELTLSDEMQTKIEQSLSENAFESYQASSDLYNKMLVKFTPIESVSFAMFMLPSGRNIHYKDINDLSHNPTETDKNIKNIKRLVENNDFKWTAEVLDSVPRLFCVRKIKGIRWSRDLGYIVIGMDNSRFIELYKNINIGEGAELLIIDSEGKVISSPNENEVGQFYYENGLIDEIVQHEEDTFESDNYENGNKVGTFDYDGNMILYKKIQGSDWYMTTKIPLSYIYTERNSIRSSLIIFIAVCFVLSILLSYTISGSISKPLGKIVYMIQEAKNGNLAIDIKDNNKDEIAVVIRNFNEMAANIRMLIEQVRYLAVENILKSSEVIADSSKQSHMSSEQISFAVQEVAEGASKQVQEIHNTEASMNLLVDSFNEVENTMGAVLEMVYDTKEISDRSLDTVKHLNDKADETSAASKEVIEDIVELNEYMGQIRKIVELIVGISNQTKLLALNASIEAAKAGEAGKGFGVVASEVKKLAHRSKEASVSINSIISSILQKTEKTVDTAYRANSIIDVQMDAVRETDSTFRKICNAMSGISQHVDSVSDSLDKALESKDKAVYSIERISALADQAALSAEEAAASTEEQIYSAEELSLFSSKFNDMAHKLGEAVDKFKLK